MSKLTRMIGATALVALVAACGSPDKQETTEQPSEEAAAPEATAPEAAAPEAAEAPAAAGEATAAAAPAEFNQCKSCHSATPGKNGVGPSLAGVFGTKAAEVPGYTFSAAMKSSGLTWDKDTLDRYLEAPQKVVPGTKMTFPGIKDAAKRAAVVAYLESIK